MSSYYDWSEISRFRYANKSPFQEEGTIPMSDTIWAQIQRYFVSGGLVEPLVRTYNEIPTQSYFDVTHRLGRRLGTPGFEWVSILGQM